MKPWTEIEAALARAVDHGIEPNFGRWVRFAGIQPAEWMELQVLGLRTTYGEKTRCAHVASVEAAVELLAAAERFNASGAYIIANRVNDAVATRRESGCWHDAVKGQSTTDKDIVARRVLLIDVDAKRPSGTSATDEEVGSTVPVAAAVHERLAQAFGEEALGIGNSGNGRQIFVALEQTSEAEGVAATVREFLTVLGQRFSTEEAHIDAGVFDAKRLVPAFGTLKRKGAAGIVQRPHRRTSFVCADRVVRVRMDQVEELIPWLRAELPAPADAPRPARTSKPSPGGASPSYARVNALAIEDVAARVGVLDDGEPRCPGCGNTKGVAFVNNGLKCLHNTCSLRGAPGRAGFRTPVDLVMEAKGVRSGEAVAFLEREFGLGPLSPTKRASRPPPAVATEPSAERKRILLDTEEQKIADLAIQALVEGGADLYQRGGALVRVVSDDDKPRILTLPQPTLRELLAHHAEFLDLRRTKNDEVEVNVHPPRWCVEAVHARGEWDGIRPLRSVVAFPVMRPDGSLLTEPGYDPATQLLYVPAGDVDEVPDAPTLEEVTAARDAVLDVFHDFPFRGEANRSACIAALLTPFARHAFKGAVPCVLIDGNAPGAGKGLIANAIGTIVTGRELDVRSETDNEDEFRKRIMSIARTGDPIVLIDNVTKPLGGGALDAALTTTGSWSDRGMGTFDEVRTPMTALWMFTGNNIEFRRKDTKRRSLHVRLEPEDANPENRQGFKHYPLLPYVHANRPRLVAAALTLLRGYVVAGRPTAPLPLWGSFEEWSALVRQTLVWCGLPDPYEARAGLDEGDTETAALGCLLEGWTELAKDLGGAREACTVSEALEALRHDDLAWSTPEMRRHPTTYAKLRLALAEMISTPPGMLPNVHRTGSLLRRFRGRVVNGRKLTCALYGGSNAWRVITAGVPAELPHPAPPEEPAAQVELSGIDNWP